MPELFRFFGLRFAFFSNDHPPIHVNVRGSDGSAKFEVSPVLLIENKGLKPKDLKLAEALILENEDLIINRWNDFFDS
ncbi:MAG: DUF4160 domain-containing protein [Sphingobacteriaceae bacterium]|nr:DUF4160 domain-containing protein [Cytophagaceae bacterium]